MMNEFSKLFQEDVAVTTRLLLVLNRHPEVAANLLVSKPWLL